MNGDTNRSDPVAHWTRKQHFYTTPNVTNQLLGSKGSSTQAINNFEDRHILRLQEKGSWIPASKDRAPRLVMPFVQAYSDLPGNSLTPGEEIAANWTALLMKGYHAKTQSAQPLGELQAVLTDDTLVYLFDDLMKSSNNSIGRALSALITVLSGMAYYDELPLFHGEANVTQAFFTDVLFPQRVGGFWVVVTVVLLHSLLIMAVTMAFLLRSKMSFGGSHWHTAVQLSSADTKAVFAHGSMHTDKEVKEQFGFGPTQNEVARLTVDDKGMSAYIRVNGLDQDHGPSDCKAC